MTVLFGPYAPSTHAREQPVRDCCARCRRGTRQHGVMPCGYALNCPNGCHKPGYRERTTILDVE